MDASQLPKRPKNLRIGIKFCGGGGEGSIINPQSKSFVQKAFGRNGPKQVTPDTDDDEGFATFFDPQSAKNWKKIGDHKKQLTKVFLPAHLSKLQP